MIDGERDKNSRWLINQNWSVLMIGILFATSCELPPANGKMTVRVSDFSIVNGGQIFVRVYNYAGVIVGMNNPALDGLIGGGWGITLVRDPISDSAFVGIGGAAYRVYVFIDTDNDGSFLETGVDYAHISMMELPGYLNMTTDGDTTLSFSQSDFARIP